MSILSGPVSPFALFVLSDKIGADYINRFVQRTANSNDGDFFLTVVHIQDDFNPYICAPNIRTIDKGDDERNLDEQGTRPPITNCFTLPFVGKSLKDCAEYLRKSPDGKAWSNEYFCALSEEDVGGDTVMLEIVHGFWG
ncbi:hypothetical protein LMH87_005159 [Akanthomyces muscarius]|uniref:Uncharacterized protein n=1 Tax=Akanthomyces muscarius TaxID=2231603 RepID=A0A9W8QK56_AKAMU|nr:hypothetical protein LMH87_005159 [Akanthomyces muscarius]KAJ4163428.1 hypothetical protein LMH87_005159 [Akanthomyces muscarius]